MNIEQRTCQNCNNTFEIDAEDFDFYKKIEVPAPTFCPECRMQRRMMIRNESTLYKGTCAITRQPLVTIFSPDKNVKVLHQKVWWGDDWDQYEHGMDYDPSRNFFDQFRALQKKTFWMNLIVDSDLVNSEYVNHTGRSKDTYLSFNVDRCENVLYANTGATARDSMELQTFSDIELSYEVINSANTSQSYFSEDCSQCLDVFFSKNLVGCTHCFGCINLRQKKYCMWNEQLTKEEYEEKMAQYELDKYSVIQDLRLKAYEFWLQHPRKYIDAHHVVDSTGDYIAYAKNCQNIYQSRLIEDSKFCSFMTVGKTNDCYDICEWGANLQLSYEGITVGDESQGIKFCFGSWKGASDTEYCMMTPGSRNCFGCCNMKKAEYCILNKQYSKEEYFKLREQIISDMNNNPYIDKQGRVFTYGEFFPYDLSMFDYNESWAQDYFPLTKDQVLQRGFRWKDEEENKHQITLHTKDIPDSIHDIDESILREVLGCGACGRAYRVVVAELQLLKRFGLPVPRTCTKCRHTNRLSRINPPKLYQRITEDGVEVMTSYAPDRPEKIYSEEGYNRLVN
ncbi:MAG: hypothetical protein KBC22_01145 [Candidatus Pacebacteria bacterium]|nr:hypothetical protein [Candidatus Paceibacterota bacterium]